MRVGHGAAPLGLVLGEPMGGYVARAGGLSGALDPLEVHVLSFSEEATRFLLVVIDVVCVNDDLVAAIRDRLGADHATTVWVAATHTHSAPETGCRPGGGPTPAAVVDRLLDAAASAASAAMTDERQARAQVVRGRRAEVGARRTGPAPDPVDIPVDAVLLRSTETDTVLGALVVTPVHPTVLPADNRAASADLSGAVRRAVAERWGGWGVAATGAAGDISTRGARRGRDAVELDRLAALVVEAIPDDPGATVPDHAVADAATDTDTVRRAIAKGELAANTIDASALSTPDGDRVEAARWREVYEQGRRALLDLGGRHGSDPVSLVIEAVGVGSIRFVGIPGEPFLELGERIHAATGAIVLGCTNGYVGYLPAVGTGLTYETIISPVAADGTDEIVRLGVAAVDSLR